MNVSLWNHFESVWVVLKALVVVIVVNGASGDSLCNVSKVETALASFNSDWWLSNDCFINVWSPLEAFTGFVFSGPLEFLLASSFVFWVCRSRRAKLPLHENGTRIVSLSGFLRCWKWTHMEIKEVRWMNKKIDRKWPQLCSARKQMQIMFISSISHRMRRTM